MRSTPKPSTGHGLSEATQSVADSVRLAPVPLELLALGLHHGCGRTRDEALVRKHPLRPRDLLLEPRDLRSCIAVGLHPLGLDDRGEDPCIVALQARQHAAAPEALGRLLNPYERAGVGLERLIGSRPRRD